MGLHRPYKARKFAVGERLLALRNRSRLTQTQLAARIGASRRTVQSWEAGEAYPQEEKLRHLISIFLAEGAFTAGSEYEDMLALWRMVDQDAPRHLAPFDEKWFAALQAQLPLPHLQEIAEAPPSLPTLSDQRPHSEPKQSAVIVDWGKRQIYRCSMAARARWRR